MRRETGRKRKGGREEEEEEEEHSCGPEQRVILGPEASTSPRDLLKCN